MNHEKTPYTIDFNVKGASFWKVEMRPNHTLDAAIGHADMRGQELASQYGFKRVEYIIRDRENTTVATALIQVK